MRRIGPVILWIVGLYLVARAVVEPFVIDMHDPATYHLDWGGPHLAGVLAVHCGPGLLSLALMLGWLARRRRRMPSSVVARSLPSDGG
jgi:hypothetical protein